MFFTLVLKLSDCSESLQCTEVKKAERPASTDEGTQEKLQQLHCLEEEVGVMSDVLPSGYSRYSL